MPAQRIKLTFGAADLAASADTFLRAILCIVCREFSNVRRRRRRRLREGLGVEDQAGHRRVAEKAHTVKSVGVQIVDCRGGLPHIPDPLSFRVTPCYWLRSSRSIHPDVVLHIQVYV